MLQNSIEKFFDWRQNLAADILKTLPPAHGS